MFTDHAWLDDERLVGTTVEGDTFILDNLELKQTIENPF